MNFFKKPSTPLLLIGIGILIFVLGLSAVFSLTGKTETELLNGYTQQVSLNTTEPKLISGSAGKKLNIQFAGNRSVGGAFAGEDLVLTLRDPESDKVLLQIKDFASLDWKEENFAANLQTRQILIQASFDLPADLAIGTIYEGELTGMIRYPIEQNKMIIEEHVEINQEFNLKVINDEALLKMVRQRPICIILISFPLSMILILIGLKAEFYGRNARPQT